MCEDKNDIGGMGEMCNIGGRKSEEVMIERVYEK